VCGADWEARKGTKKEGTGRLLCIKNETMGVLWGIVKEEGAAYEASVHKYTKPLAWPSHLRMSTMALRLASTLS
jgi:hypothetical protein